MFRDRSMNIESVIERKQFKAELNELFKQNNKKKE